MSGFLVAFAGQLNFHSICEVMRDVLMQWTSLVTRDKNELKLEVVLKMNGPKGVILGAGGFEIQVSALTASEAGAEMYIYMLMLMELSSVSDCSSGPFVHWHLFVVGLSWSSESELSSVWVAELGVEVVAFEIQIVELRVFFLVLGFFLALDLGMYENHFCWTAHVIACCEEQSTNSTHFQAEMREWCCHKSLDQKSALLTLHLLHSEPWLRYWMVVNEKHKFKVRKDRTTQMH